MKLKAFWLALLFSSELASSQDLSDLGEQEGVDFLPQDFGGDSDQAPILEEEDLGTLSLSLKPLAAKKLNEKDLFYYDHKLIASFASWTGYFGHILRDSHYVSFHKDVINFIASMAHLIFSENPSQGASWYEAHEYAARLWEKSRPWGDVVARVELELKKNIQKKYKKNELTKIANSLRKIWKKNRKTFLAYAYLADSKETPFIFELMDEVERRVNLSQRVYSEVEFTKSKKSSDYFYHPREMDKLLETEFKPTTDWLIESFLNHSLGGTGEDGKRISARDHLKSFLKDRIPKGSLLDEVSEQIYDAWIKDMLRSGMHYGLTQVLDQHRALVNLEKLSWTEVEVNEKDWQLGAYVYPSLKEMLGSHEKFLKTHVLESFLTSILGGATGTWLGGLGAKHLVSFPDKMSNTNEYFFKDSENFIGKTLNSEGLKFKTTKMVPLVFGKILGEMIGREIMTYFTKLTLKKKDFQEEPLAFVVDPQGRERYVYATSLDFYKQAKRKFFIQKHEMMTREDIKSRSLILGKPVFDFDRRAKDNVAKKIKLLSLDLLNRLTVGTFSAITFEYKKDWKINKTYFYIRGMTFLKQVSGNFYKSLFEQGEKSLNRRGQVIGYTLDSKGIIREVHYPKSWE